MSPSTQSESKHSLKNSLSNAPATIKILSELNNNCQAVTCVMTFEKITEHFGTRGLSASKIQRFLDSGVDINQRSSRMAWTLLHFAAENCDRDIIQLLAAHGADLDAKNLNGWTPLHIAADSDLETSGRDGRKAMDLPTVRLLVELGADPEARTADGLTARDIARGYGLEKLYDSALDPSRLIRH